MTVKVVETIDTHTLGEPTRTVVAGFPRLRGRTLAARSADLLARHDSLRCALMWEPRGHRMMFGAVVVPPAAASADVGLVFMDGGGAVPMCVHGTIGAVTALVETGRLRVPGDRLVVDTPDRPLEVGIRRQGRRVAEVSLLAPPARVVRRGLEAQSGRRRVAYDLAYAGNLVALVEARQLGVELEPAQAARLIEAGTAVKHAAQSVMPEVVACVIHEERGPGRYRDFVAFRDGSCDRSPCGSCFAALMALLHEQGRLEPGTWTECESVLGLSFRGRLLARAGELVPELVGSAFITGEHWFRIDALDPLRHGFVL